jgi:protein involved in polysaccharide export with SLBB domain
MQQVGRVSKHVWLVFVLTAVVVGCAAKEGTITLIPFTPLATQSDNREYIVQAGDTLNIKFYYHPDHDQRDLIVRPDGRLLLPLVGDIQAAGLTPEQLAEHIAQRYAFTLREPKVVVDVKTANTGQVYVGGEVQRPGVIKLKPKMNVLQAIFEAGGPKNSGDVERVVLLRSVGDNQFGYRELNLMRILRHKDTANDAVLAQDDLIFIPQTGIAKVNVWVEQYIQNMMPFGSPIRPMVPFGF